MKLSVEIILFVCSTVALADCSDSFAKQKPQVRLDGRGAYGSAADVRQIPSDARPVYPAYGSPHERERCNSQQFPQCGDN